MRKSRRGAHAGGSRREGRGKLVPIDHLKVLYEGSGASAGKSRRINQKKDLLDAVRRMSPSRTEVLSQKGKGGRKKTKHVKKEDTRVNLGNNEMKNLEARAPPPHPRTHPAARLPHIATA